ncbi:hypothetical protein DFH28DRAFT_927605 [Melampsora americana]|nr:hypothetical protein DFH28DRAFT_927605 [Melampsora americana]
MSSSQLFLEIVRQNQLLKETINSFEFSLNHSSNQESNLDHSFDSEEEEIHSNLSYSTSSTTLTDHHPSFNSIHQTRIETLIDLLNKQEDRLNLIEDFRNQTFLTNQTQSIPIYRGLKRSKDNPNEIQIKEWCEMISNRLNLFKSSHQISLNPKVFLKFILNHLEFKPFQLVYNLLERNQDLIQSKFSNQLPIKLDHSNHHPTHPQNQLDDLFEYPFKLHVLRHPRALLNLLQSKFSELDQRPTSLKDLNRIEIKPGDSLLLR